MNRKEKALEFVDQEYHIHITGRNIQVTDFMKDYAMEKISKIERFTNRIIDIYVTMDIQKINHHVEIILKTGNLKITSQANTTDMYVSIDKAVDKLEAQILRYKSKLQDHHARGHADLNMIANVIGQPAVEEFEFEEEETLDNKPIDSLKPHQVVKKEKHPLKILTYDEAIMKMELSNDMFLIFKDEEDQKLKVIYRRKDDQYGIIEPIC